MPRKRSGHDPLIEAVLGRIPSNGSTWNTNDREAWVTMFRNACDVVYGPAERSSTPAVAAAAPAPIVPKADPTGGAPFYVDAEGCVRAAIDGRPVMPEEVTPDEPVYFDRTKGHTRDTVIWADGSAGTPRGINYCGPG